MWDSAVRWTFAADPDPKLDEPAHETSVSASTKSKPKRKTRTTDAHDFTTLRPTPHQPRGVPSLLVQKGKSEPVVSVPDPAICGSAVLVKGDALNTLATMASPAMASPGSVSSISSLSSPPDSPLDSPSRSPSPAAPSPPSPPESATLAPTSPQNPTSDDKPDTAAIRPEIDAMQPPPYPDPDPVTEAFLAPMKTQLEKLRLSTASAAPTPNMRAYFPSMKSHLQLLRERLEPVGAFIVQEVEKLERGGGAVEMRVCHHIARHHWPLPPTPGEATHLRIHEMYRNALFKRAHLALRPPPPQTQPQPHPIPPPRTPPLDEDSADDMPALEPAAAPFTKSAKNKLSSSVMKLTKLLHKDKGKDDAAKQGKDTHDDDNSSVD
ncbi:uncharacterized protein CC84DRAFT_1220661 [Paraphaeosphaeria sporulosa]|uniref:Uncharacterized protein n=1 Tax=Paraphaeosphaeria sporulosa TaxID=1460663 RepID=A0A177C6J5_9PLEO|nr:uncharacterized protein CC84DRAFT_1220661 [Paraphaeosphaeria sporulosa]OAG02320.1 hypothetical protein CC84DRAFT_1220661 [Paraphaeosphaeria sporulosa]